MNFNERTQMLGDPLRSTQFQVDAILEQAAAPLGFFGYPKLVLVMHSPEMSTILSGEVVAVDF